MDFLNGADVISLVALIRLSVLLVINLRRMSSDFRVLVTCSLFLSPLLLSHVSSVNSFLNSELVHLLAVYKEMVSATVEALQSYLRRHTPKYAIVNNRDSVA